MEYRYLVSDVLKAMEKHELKVYYQPKYDAVTNRMKSSEALVRWVQEDGAVVLPGGVPPGHGAVGRHHHAGLVCAGRGL